MRFTILLAVAVLLGAPAGAIDLTGTWVGDFKCTEFDGVKTKQPDPGQTLQITQTGNALNVEWGGASSFEGFAVADAKKPDNKGMAAIIDCDTTNDIASASTYGEMANLQLKVDRVKGKGKLKGSSLYTSDGDTIGECKWKFTLINMADPSAPGCP
jgi:hypothetical protein